MSNHQGLALDRPARGYSVYPPYHLTRDTTTTAAAVWKDVRRVLERHVRYIYSRRVKINIIMLSSRSP